MRKSFLIAGILLVSLTLPAVRAGAQYEGEGTLGPMITPDTTEADVPGSGVGDVPSSPGRIHWGKLKILPSLGFSTTYDDNIFLSSGAYSVLVLGLPGGGRYPVLDEARIGDVVFQFTPALGLSLPFKAQRGRVAVGYVGDFALYANRGENNWDRNVVDFDFEYKAPQGLSFSLKNGFTDTSDPFGSLDQYEIGVKKHRWYDELEPTLGYQFSRRFRAFLYYTFYNQKYRELVDFTQNYRYNEVGPGFEVLVLPKTWAFARYHYVIKDYYSDSPLAPLYTGAPVSAANNASNDRHRVDVGLTWDATSKITGELNVGWEWVDYKNASDPGGVPYVNESLPVVRTDLNYQFSPETLASLYISREWRESGAGTVEAFASTGVGVNLSHSFLRKYQARAGFGYANDDYNIPSFEWSKPIHTSADVINGTEGDRNDNNYSTALSLAYRIQDWLRVGVTYNLFAKVSNYEQYSFVDNKGTVWAVAAY